MNISGLDGLRKNALYADYMLSNRILSDEEFKEFGDDLDPKLIARIILESGDELTPEIMEFLLEQTDAPFDYDFERDGHRWRDDVLDKYAEHIRNYHYTYKPEATAVDASIDPDEEHIGPMAQDIERVNPACVVETPEGVKTVDTGRLALMNAGAIAELAREIAALKHGAVAEA
jgi:hypothetical protein